VWLAARRMKEEDNDLYAILLYFRPTATIAVEDLFLQKQLGLYVQRNRKISGVE
jgi:hypothetical protein